jgi:hypothetical protein
MENIYIGLIIFIIAVIIFYANDKSGFNPLRGQIGAYPPLRDIPDLHKNMDKKCNCNKLGACDYCLDLNMEERTDHINHMLNKKPNKLSASLSQLRGAVHGDIVSDNPARMNS